MKTLTVFICTFLLLVSPAFSADKEHPKPAMPAEFENMKKLLGSWKGTSTSNDKSGDNNSEQPVAIVYELTAGGTAIKQTMMPGTPHEMVTVYHKSGNSLAMTHYCTLGNQPFMKLQSANENSLAFVMKEPVGISAETEPHMHAVTLSLSEDGALEEEWVYYVNNKEAGRTHFSLNRSSP